jgi:hypothetical protein
MNKEKPVQYLQLKPNHTVMQKLDQIFGLMEELDIKLSVYQRGIVIDYDGKTYELEDLENNWAVDCLPPAIEYRVKTENPEYTKWFERKQEEERKEQETIRLEAEKRKKEDEEQRMKTLEIMDMRKRVRYKYDEKIENMSYDELISVLSKD